MTPPEKINRPMQSEFNMNMFMGDESFIKGYQAKYARLFSAGARVLDIGSGEGYFLELLAARGVSGVGIDHSERAVAAARKRGMQAILGDPFAHLRAEEGTFDGIFCCHVIEHFPPERAQELIGLAARRLAPGGLLVLVTPNVGNIEVLSEIFWRDPTHVRPYPLVLLEEMVKHAGFLLVRSGIDRETGRRMPRRSPRLALKHILMKIRFGEYYGRGDTFIVARMPEELVAGNGPR